MKALRHLLRLAAVAALALTASTGAGAQTVRDASNRQIGKIESDGTVRDASNRQMGSARGANRQWAAVFFFFDLL